MQLDAKIPSGPIAEKWTRHQFDMKLVNPANKRKYKVIVVGTGLAAGAAAATMGELGYNVEAFTFHDSPRRAHSIAAQGGINAAKNYQGDGDSIYRLFYDTVKGGDFRSREANVYRLAELSLNIIDQAVAQGVPSPASTGVSWPTGPSVAPRSPGPSTPGGRRGSSSSWAPTRRWSGRSPRAR
jgi:succinate dehydrogenase / fumarate reductase, flavoprotein subunit